LLLLLLMLLFLTLAVHSKTPVGARGHSTRRTYRQNETEQQVIRAHPAILHLCIMR